MQRQEDGGACWLTQDWLNGSVNTGQQNMIESHTGLPVPRGPLSKSLPTPQFCHLPTYLTGHSGAKSLFYGPGICPQGAPRRSLRWHRWGVRDSGGRKRGRSGGWEAEQNREQGMDRSIGSRAEATAGKGVPAGASRLETGGCRHLGVAMRNLEPAQGGAEAPSRAPSSSSHCGLELPSMVPGCQSPSAGGSRGHKEQGQVPADWVRQEQGGYLHCKELTCRIKDPEDSGARSSCG